MAINPSQGMADVILRISAFDETRAVFRGLSKSVNNYLAGVQNSMRAGVKEIDEVLAGLDKQVAKTTKDAGRRFDMNALSVLFFGQAIQQASMQAARFGVKAYTDIMHSVEGTATATDYLNAATTYLGFAIGQALEPVVAMIAPIVTSLAEFISEHETLTRSLIVGGVVIGGLLFLYGTLKLGVVGVMNVVKDASGAFSSLSAAMNGVKKADLSGLQNLKTLLAVGIVAGIVAVLYWIYKMQEAMGGWGEFWKSVVRGVLRVNAILLAGIAGVVAEIKNAFDWVWNQILGGLEWFINKAVVFINKFVDGINKVFGTSIGKLSPISFSSWKAEVQDFGDAFMLTYDKMLSSYLAFEDKYLAPEKGYVNSINGWVPDYAAEAQRASEMATAGATNQVVYNQNTINLNGLTQDGMDQVRRAFEAQGISVPR